MAGLNQFIGIGNLTDDPKLTYTPGGTARCALAIAINRKYKDASGNFQDEVTFVPVVAWGTRGEACAKVLRKGRQVAVSGRLRIDSFTGSDGEKVKVVEIVAQDIQFLGPKPVDTAAPAYEAEPVEPANGQLSEEEVPF